MITAKKGPGAGNPCLPPNWKDLSTEIERLCLITYPDFYERAYISTASLYREFLADPGKYPLLKDMAPDTGKRWISRYLHHDQGMEKRSKKSRHGTMTWMRPGLVSA
jgi:hypothetical protein